MRSALLCIYHLSYSWTPRVRSASECMVNACMAVASSVYSLGGGVRVGGPLQESRERSAVECPAGSPNGPGTGPRRPAPPARPPSARRASRFSLEPSSLDALRPSGGERRDPTERPRGAARRTVPPLTAAGRWPLPPVAVRPPPDGATGPARDPACSRTRSNFGRITQKCMTRQVVK
jgi:hypothetical protein